jgi:pimeloyl-ACP methyl ester carboxylesterase
VSEQTVEALTSHIYISQRLRLHYVTSGNSTSPPLLLLHGGQDHCRSWDWVARNLRSDFHVIAPDLRGHGDSQWSPDGNYSLAAFVYDLGQLIHQQKLAPLTIVAHSLGGNIALRYAGIYPANVRKIVSIEGLGLSPKLAAERAAKSVDQRMRDWLHEQRSLSARQPRRYATIDQALDRMREQNSRLTLEQSRHLTIHGISQNEDGTFSWKFDNYVRSSPPVDLTEDEIHQLWGRIACPTLLVYGIESWASNPAIDGRLKHFRHARVALFERAGHWIHHDRLDDFLLEVRQFLQD